MPIPAFDLNLVLPPHLGNPTVAAELSPYPCTSVELCDRFGSTPNRIAILRGLLALRGQLRASKMTTGFQWIDGSFSTDVETAEGRPPNDVDVVTFFWSPDPNFVANLIASFPEITDRDQIKNKYRVDHFPLDVGRHPELTVEMTRYWCGLFSHGRNSVWKGMLRIELDTAVEDSDALAILDQRSAPGGLTP